MEKTLERVQERIGLKQFYEAHQAVRTVVARYVRQKAYDDAIDLLSGSCLLLASAGQTGSVIDLLLYLITIYGTAKVQLDASSRGRIAQIVWKIDPTELALKQVAQQVDNWASRSGGFPTGDSELHHVFGVQFSRGGQAIEAEKHLLLGVRDSAVELADTHRRWYLSDKANAPFYVSRGVFGYLSNQNFRNIQVYLERILPFVAEDLNTPTQKDGDVLVFDEIPVLNFLQLLVLTAQKKEQVAYRQLVLKYTPKQYPAWAESLAYVEREYFGMVPQHSMNLMDLMGGMLGN